jgi:hypothetical protein
VASAPRADEVNDDKAAFLALVAEEGVWASESRSSVMNRTIAVSLLALGVVVGYAGHGVRTEAQAIRFTEFPFTAGERVSVALVGVEDRGIETCDIVGQVGDFLMCKGAGDQPFAFAIKNIAKVTRVANSR